MKKHDGKQEIIKDVTKIDNGIIYRYILSSRSSRKVASFQLPLYSVEVIMTKDGEVTRSSVDDVFADVGKALSFYEYVSKNLATPIDLAYALEDKVEI
ncbi:MAG: hypothetical protein E7673_05875 [Ruminococcaceae bacterium]|nr:hypothetical protein [Oscillospiraceae bacterium]